jgi:predicted outer membrane repeat protein
MALAAAAPSATVVVDLTGGGDYEAIQEGIDAAAEGDTVVVAPGTYRGALNREIDTRGKILTLRSSSGRQDTVIDCQLQGRGFHIHLGESSDTVIRGFTVINGFADEGGALLIYNSGPIVEDCAFIGNVATMGGAATIRVDSSPQFDGCLFEDNYASSYGGAIYTHLATPYVSRCEFTGNTAMLNGGAISLKTGTVARIYECEFTENWSDCGGAIFVAILAEPQALRDIPEASIISTCRFIGNSANHGGGLYVSAFSWSLCTYSVFAHNVAEEGGAIYVLSDISPTLTIEYCTLALNSAIYGGGIFAKGGNDQYQAIVKTSIIAFNEQGEALHRSEGAPVTVDMVSCYANAGGDDLIGTRLLYMDPLFCGIDNDDFALCSNSACRQVNNPWHYLFGATARYCGSCTSPVQATSWGSIKGMFR